METHGFSRVMKCTSAVRQASFLCSGALTLVTSPFLRTCLKFSHESLTFWHISWMEYPLLTLVTIQSGASTHSKSVDDSSCSKNGRNPLPVTEFRSPFSDFQIIFPLINVLSELSLMTQYGINGFISTADIITSPHFSDTTVL